MGTFAYSWAPCKGKPEAHVQCWVSCGTSSNRFYLIEVGVSARDMLDPSKSTAKRSDYQLRPDPRSNQSDLAMPNTAWASKGTRRTSRITGNEMPILIEEH